MTIFLLIGCIGLALVIVGLVIGEIFGDLFDSVLPNFDGGGFLSTPVIGGFLAALGFGAALILYSTSASTGVAAVGGLGSGVIVGGIAAAFTRSVMNMPTDASVRSGDMTGLVGTVITRIPANGLGELSLAFHGQMMKVSARSSAVVEAGTSVVVVSVTSPSSVVVEPVSSQPNEEKE